MSSSDFFIAPEHREAYERAAQEQLDSALSSFYCLTNEQKLDIFCAVVFLLKKFEMDEQKSYRGVLYDGFGFGLESYTRALEAGFVELHNAIYSPERLLSLVQAAMDMRVDGAFDAKEALSVLRKKGLA